jgi:hypothetical protein
MRVAGRRVGAAAEQQAPCHTLRLRGAALRVRAAALRRRSWAVGAARPLLQREHATERGGAWRARAALQQQRCAAPPPQLQTPALAAKRAARPRYYRRCEAQQVWKKRRH